MALLLNSPTLLFFFIISFFTISHIACQKHHPLDPLSPTELNLVSAIVQKSYPSSDRNNLTFQYVGLDDPEKQTILSWQSNPTKTPLPPRRALVVIRFNKQTHEIVVDLPTSSVISKKVYKGLGYPMLNLEKRTLASELPFSYGPFKESVKKRGLDISQVVCSTFSVGWFGEQTSKRLLKLSCFYTNGTVNLFVRPLEGITVAVDLDTMQIARYQDRFMVPVPKGEGTEYRFSKLRPPFGPRLTNLAVFHPTAQGSNLTDILSGQ